MIHYRRMGERAIIGYDPETGVMYRVYMKTTSDKVRIKAIRHRNDSRTSAGNHWKRKSPIMVDWINYQAARVAWYVMTGELPHPAAIVAHKDGNSLNDRWDNLALAPRRKPSRKEVGSWLEKEQRGWCYRESDGAKYATYYYWAAPKINGRTYNLGCFPHKKDAILAIKKIYKQTIGVTLCDFIDKMAKVVPPDRTKKRY